MLRHACTTHDNLTAVAVSATLHCLTGCAIGEIAGHDHRDRARALELATIVLSIALAFVFGYALTSLPLLRAGLALAAVVPIALASDTLSIATMEVVDNAIVLVVPGAMDAGLGDLLFWGSLAFSLAIAGVVAVPVNRWLIARGKGHAVVHETGIHGGPPIPRGRRRSPWPRSCSGASCSAPRRSARRASGTRSSGGLRKISPRISAGRAGSSQPGSRSSSVASATCASSRARCIPTHTCGPPANARWRPVFARAGSKRSGSGNVAGSRLAAVIEIRTRSPAAISAPPSTCRAVA